jgi:hypothetical protein
MRRTESESESSVTRNTPLHGSIQAVPRLKRFDCVG